MRFVIDILQLRARLAEFRGEKGGATAIEYGLIAALISIAAIAAWSLVGTSLSSTFSTIGNDI